MCQYVCAEQRYDAIDVRRQRQQNNVSGTFDRSRVRRYPEKFGKYRSDTVLPLSVLGYVVLLLFDSIIRRIIEMLSTQPVNTDKLCVSFHTANSFRLMFADGNKKVKY